MRLRIAILCAAAGLASVAAALASAASGTSGRTVPCGESIDSTRFPYVGDRRPRYRYRLVLGAVSVPPAYLAQVVPTGETPWAYWRKAGLVVRAGGSAVSISVPPAWRARAPGKKAETVHRGKFGPEGIRDAVLVPANHPRAEAGEQDARLPRLAQDLVEPVHAPDCERIRSVASGDEDDVMSERQFVEV